jgi:hypothetical protein
MLSALFRRELVGQLASFGSQSAAGSFFRVVELLLRDALRLFHNKLNLPFLKSVVNSRMSLSSSAGGVALGAKAGRGAVEGIRLSPRRFHPSSLSGISAFSFQYFSFCQWSLRP